MPKASVSSNGIEMDSDIPPKKDSLLDFQKDLPRFQKDLPGALARQDLFLRIVARPNLLPPHRLCGKMYPKMAFLDSKGKKRLPR